MREVRRGQGVGEERRGAHRVGDPLGLDELHEVGRVPDLLQDETRAGAQGELHAVEEAGLVPERRRHVADVARGGAERALDRLDRGRDRVGGVHHALRLAGGAGGEHQLDDVVGPGTQQAEQAAKPIVAGAAVEQLVPARPVTRPAVADDDARGQ